MASTTLPNLGLEYDWDLGENWKTGMDANMKLLDTTVNSAVIDRDLTAPPGSPTLGDRYIPAATATGDWATHEDDLALWDGVAWVFFTPVEGWTVWVNDEDIYAGWNGSSWQQIAGGVGSGDVVGPGSATDKAVARFSGTGGKTIQNSGVIIDNDDNTYGFGTLLKTVSGTTYTLLGSDRGKTIMTTNASAVTITIPQTSTESIADGYVVTVLQRGAGQVTFAVEGTDTLESRNSETKIANQYSAAVVYKVVEGSPNTYLLAGDTTT